jgi:hypothetical protein
MTRSCRQLRDSLRAAGGPSHLCTGGQHQQESATAANTLAKSAVQHWVGMGRCSGEPVHRVFFVGDNLQERCLSGVMLS